MDLIIAGDIQTILNGRVTKKTLFPLPLNKMAYALGGAAIPNTLSIGETIIYEKKGHIFTKEQAIEESNTLNAAFLMGIESKPKTPFSIREKSSIASFYQDLLKKYPKGFAITGSALFSKLSTAYLKLSPIYGENINENREKYWEEEADLNQKADLFGVVLKDPDPRAFYHNPNEKVKNSLSSHTHVLSPLARHLLTDSEILSGEFWVEGIHHIKTM